MYTEDQFLEFFRGYAEALMECTEIPDAIPWSLDERYAVEDIPDDDRDAMKEDCAHFLMWAKEVIDDHWDVAGMLFAYSRSEGNDQGFNVPEDWPYDNGAQLNILARSYAKVQLTADDNWALVYCPL